MNHVKIYNALQTNGYCLDEEWCHFFAENHFLLGVSVDGLKATHDAYRKDAAGQDTYFRVLEGIKRLEKYGVDYNILTVVNAKTAPKIRKIYEQYRKNGWQLSAVHCLSGSFGRKAGYKGILFNAWYVWAVFVRFIRAVGA